MRSMFPKNLSTSGKLFTNERTSVSFKGILVLNQGKPRIDFENNIDVKSGLSPPAQTPKTKGFYPVLSFTRFF